MDWDDEKILNTNVFNEFEETSTLYGFYDYMTEVFNLDHEDEDELIYGTDDEGTVSEIIHKIAEIWDGKSSKA